MSDYMTKIYRDTGGDREVIKSGGELQGESGGIGDFQDGFTFYLGTIAGASGMTAQQIGAYLATKLNRTFIGQSQGAGSSVLSILGGSSPPVLPSFNNIVFSIGGGSANSASARMWSGHKGENIYIMMMGSMSTAGVLIVFSNSGFNGVSCEGLTNSRAALSAMKLVASATSVAWVRLACYTDGTWSILEKSISGLTEYPAT